MARFDVVVIGGGPGGYGAALYGASAGLNVALVEARDIGGTCLNRGCIPAKELLQTAEVFRTVAGAGEFGVQVGAPSIDWTQAVKRQGQVVSRLVKGTTGLLGRREVAMYAGFGRLAGAGVVDVMGSDGAGERIEADAVILATGSAPATIPGFDIDGDRICTSDQALFWDPLPRSVAIVGAGVIGAEFASALTDVGVQVLLLEALPKMLGSSDPELSEHLRKELVKRRVDVRLGASVTGHRPAETPGMETIAFTHSGEDLEADVEKVLVAVGRRPYTGGMGFAEAGVAVDARGFIEVDPETLRTSVDGVWALGDCIATPALAHVAYAEAMVAIRAILGEAPAPVNYDGVPWCVYTHPEVAWAGLDEDEARARGYEVEVVKTNYAAIGRAMILGETKGFVKIVADAKTGRMLGVHIVGPWATEQLTEGYLSVNWEATAAELGHLVHAHPTLSEAMGESALRLTGRSIH
ncbi:MAG: dihydrolipoyl dehydrogenase [Acidimicrobiia bacterium]|nr:dihydrolipoyl dehydrogenase [Acidimicrobiia bacterium]